MRSSAYNASQMQLRGKERERERERELEFSRSKGREKERVKGHVMCHDVKQCSAEGGGDLWSGLMISRTCKLFDADGEEIVPGVTEL